MGKVATTEILEGQLMAVSVAHDVPVGTLRRLLALEGDHRNLHGWGARPALRRDIAAVLEEEMRAGEAD